MATTVEGRLLCASALAYDVVDDGPVAQRHEPYSSLSGFTAAPTGLVAGPMADHACLVGDTEDGVVVAFRGTLDISSIGHEQTLRDWLNDLNVELVRGGPLPGLVHAGFWAAVDSLWNALLPIIDDRLGAAGQGASLHFAGHSKGGAMANLAAMRMLLERGVKATVHTYAGPHPGDRDFADAYDQAIPSTRYEYADDIVPLLPPATGFRALFTAVPFLRPYLHHGDRDYASVGVLAYINARGKVVQPDPLLTFRRYTHLAELIVQGHLDKIVTDHRCRCPSGYLAALCPGACPQ